MVDVARGDEQDRVAGVDETEEPALLVGEVDDLLHVQLVGLEPLPDRGTDIKPYRLDERRCAMRQGVRAPSRHTREWRRRAAPPTRRGPPPSSARTVARDPPPSVHSKDAHERHSRASHTIPCQAPHDRASLSPRFSERPRVALDEPGVRRLWRGRRAGSFAGRVVRVEKRGPMDCRRIRRGAPPGHPASRCGRPGGLVGTPHREAIPWWSTWPSGIEPHRPRDGNTRA